MFNAYEGYDHEKEKERQRGELVDRLLQSKCSQSRPWDDPEENILRVRRERVLKANRLRRLNKL